MTAQLGPGGEFASFRYATEAEVMDLLNQFGLPFGYTPLSAGLFAGVKSFHDFFGKFVFNDPNLQADRTEELYEPASSTPGIHPRIGVLMTPTEGCTSTGAHSDNTANPIYGSYLVRTAPSPIPCSEFVFDVVSGNAGVLSIRSQGPAGDNLVFTIECDTGMTFFEDHEHVTFNLAPVAGKTIRLTNGVGTYNFSTGAFPVSSLMCWSKTRAAI